MIIGVDVDGVITNIEKFINEESPKFIKENKIKLNKKKNKLCFSDLIGWSREEDDVFWNDKIWTYCDTCKPMENVDIYMNKLHDEGNKIVLVTKRKFCDEDSEDGKNMRAHLSNWLKNHNIPYDEIYYVPMNGNKSKICKTHNIEILIDDSTQNLDDVTKYIPGICMSNSGNVSYENKNVTRCENWKQVYDTITSLIKKIK